MQLFHSVVEGHDAVLATHVSTIAEGVENVLKADVGGVILYESELGRKCDGGGEVELQVASPRFLPLAQDTDGQPRSRGSSSPIHDPE